MKVIHPSKDFAERVLRDDFDGVVHMQALQRPTNDTELEVLAVYFDAGARTRPHTHPADQELYIVEGNGVVATETERLLVSAGDIVIVPAGLWHWHGAVPDSAMCHISSKSQGQSDWTVPEKNWSRYMEV